MEEVFNSDFDYITSITNNKIDELYHKVDEYSKKNNLYLDENGEYYIKYEDRFFKVGYTYGPDLFYYIEIAHEGVPYYVDYDFLDFNIISMSNMRMKKKIDDINRIICELENEGYSKKLLKKAIKL